MSDLTYFSLFCSASNPDASRIILHVVREKIMSYPFGFSDPNKQARIISGEEEGTFSWVTVNYFAGTLGVVSSIIQFVLSFVCGLNKKGTVALKAMARYVLYLSFFESRLFMLSSSHSNM